MVIVTGDRPVIQAGQRVEAAGHLALLAPPLNPGEFDYRAFHASSGNPPAPHGQRPGELLARPDPRRTAPIGSCWGESRPGAAQGLIERFDPAIAPLAAALLLGQREGIEPEVNDAFARTGTTHLLAISGLQLQALACRALARVSCRRAYAAGRLIWSSVWRWSAMPCWSDRLRRSCGRRS